MKLTKNTIAILKNFSKINDSIIIDNGDRIRTMAISEDLYAEAQIDSVFPRSFGIYDLSEFLRGIHMFDSPQLEFSDLSEYVLISENSDKTETPTTKYQFSDLQILRNTVKLPQNSAEINDPLVEFYLDYENIKKLKDACLIYGLDNISIVGCDGSVELQVRDSKNPQSHTFYINLNESNIVRVDCDFHVNIDSSKLQFLDYSYVVKLNNIGAQFESSDAGVKYVLALETSSKFDN